VTFSAYSEEELLHILRARVGETIVDHAALKFVAKKVSLASGDARSALDMLSIAVQRRLETASGEVSSDGPLITMRDVHLVSRGDKETSVKAIIEGQSTSMKVLLCILVSLSQAGVFESTLGNLRNLVNECLGEDGRTNELLPSDDFCLSLEMLVDQGLVNIAQKSSSSSSSSTISHGFLTGLTLVDRAQQRVCLGTQSEEVEQILQSDLTQSFYQRLRDTARIKGKCESNNV
jgi:Cdc6-like AAA superfamily ATPase